VSDFLHWLLSQTEHSDSVTVSHEVIQDWNPRELDWCLEREILVPAPPAEELACRQCDEQPIEPVVWITSQTEQKPRAYLPCPNCGPVLLNGAQLRQWRLDLSHLWTVLFSAALVAIQLRELAAGRLWKVGKAVWRNASWEVLVGRGLHRPDALNLLRELRLAPPSVLFVPAKLPSMETGKGPNPPVICLRDVIGWDGQRITIDCEHIEGQLAAAQPTALPRKPKPLRKRAERVANIEILVKFLKEHVEAARDYAQTTADTGDAQLLPRPSQRDLAKLVEITEMAASRCFRDPAARELRLLWELAGDLDRLLALHPARSSKAHRR
jgi:hypothetical protein